MELQRINVKFFTRDPEVPLADFIPVFHSWIQTTNGEYHDVADYSHMDGGPGIILVAHQANLSVDEQGGRRGLLFNQKQNLSGGNQDKLRDAVQQTLRSCKRLEEEPSLAGKMIFRGNEVVFVINDRLRAPNTEETFEELREDLRTIGALLFGSAEFLLQHLDNPAQRFAVRLGSPADLTASQLLANVSRE